MPDLHLVRHGETVWHSENRYAGVSDVPLTERGRRQAHALAGWAVGRGVERVVASDLSRAVDTAVPAADALGIDVETDPCLREVGFGAGEGLTRAEMAVRFPAGLEAFLAAPATCPLPGGEKGVDAARRALDSLVLLGAGPEKHVLVVAHSTLIRLVLCLALGVDPNRYREVFPRLGNVAVTSLRPTAGGWALLRYNADVGDDTQEGRP